MFSDGGTVSHTTAFPWESGNIAHTIRLEWGFPDENNFLCLWHRAYTLWAPTWSPNNTSYSSFSLLILHVQVTDADKTPPHSWMITVRMNEAEAIFSGIDSPRMPQLQTCLRSIPVMYQVLTMMPGGLQELNKCYSSFTLLLALKS